MISKTKLILILAIIYLGVASTALGFVLYEVYSSGQELENRVALIGESNAKVKMYTELTRLTEETALTRAQLREYVLDEARTSVFLTEIESIGTSLGVSLSTQALSVVPKDGAFDDLSIEFNVEGSDRGVKEMLATLETLPYHSQITSVLIAKENSGMVKGNIKLTLSLSAYDK